MGFLLLSKDECASLPMKIEIDFDGKKIATNLSCSNFTSDNTGTILGVDGLILHTSDGGITWVQQVLPDSLLVTATLNDIGGKDPATYAIAGDHGTLLNTADAGQS